MDTKNNLLACLIEKCAETQQAAYNALKHGRTNSETINYQDISREITDLIAIIDLCRQHGIAPQPEEAKAMHDKKIEKVKQAYGL